MKNDLISRKAAIEALGERPLVWTDDDQYTLGERNQYDIDRLAIETLPSAEVTLCYLGSPCEYQNADIELPSAQQWITCKERLPEANGRYLVTRGLNACGALWNRVYVANYSDLMGIKSEKIWWQGNVGKSDFERLDDVTAWMPLPKPWKEKNESHRLQV